MQIIAGGMKGRFSFSQPCEFSKPILHFLIQFIQPWKNKPEEPHVEKLNPVMVSAAGIMRLRRRWHISQMRRISNSHKVFTPNKELCMRVIINSSEVYHSGTIAQIWHNGSTVPEVNIFWGFVTFVFFTGKSWNSKNYVCAMNLKERT